MGLWPRHKRTEQNGENPDDSEKETAQRAPHCQCPTQFNGTQFNRTTRRDNTTKTEETTQPKPQAPKMKVLNKLLVIGNSNVLGLATELTTQGTPTTSFVFPGRSSQHIAERIFPGRSSQHIAERIPHCRKNPSLQIPHQPINHPPTYR
jgi:hypothetical protein